MEAKEKEKEIALKKQAEERKKAEEEKSKKEAAKREQLKNEVTDAGNKKDAISKQIANASEQVKKGFEGFLDWAKTKFANDENTLKDIERAVKALHQYPAGMIVGDENDATSLRNVKEALKVLIKYNEQRVNDEHFTGLDPLGTTFYMMATAISNADNSANPANGHTKHFNMGENLAWGYTDPNKGWYEEEKVVWEALQEFTAKYLAEHPGVNITKRGPEKTAFENAWTNYAKNEKKFFNIQTGHYTNAVNRNYIMTGIGRSTVANKRGKMVYDQQLQKFVEVGGEKKYTEDQLDSYGITFSQTFSTSTEGNGPEAEKIYTIAEFTNLFDEYMDTVDTTKLNAKLDEANKKYNDAVTARDAYKGEPALGEREVLPEEKAYDAAVEEYRKAKVAYDAKVANVEQSKEDTKKKLAEAKAELENLKKSRDKQSSVVAQKQAEYDAMVSKATDATNKATVAHNELDTITQDVNDNATKVETAKQNKAQAETELAQAKDALKTTESKLAELENKKSDLENKITNYDQELQKLADKVSDLQAQVQAAETEQLAAQQALTASQTSETNAINALNSANTVLTNAKTAYDTAKQDYDAANTMYEQAKAALETANKDVTEKSKKLNDAKVELAKYDPVAAANLLHDTQAAYDAALANLNTAQANVAAQQNIVNDANQTLAEKQAILDALLAKYQDLMNKYNASVAANNAYIASQQANNPLNTGVITYVPSSSTSSTDKTVSNSKNEPNKNNEKKDDKKTDDEKKDDKKNDSKTSEDSSKQNENDSDPAKTNNALPIGIGILATGAIAGIGFIIVKKKREEE